MQYGWMSIVTAVICFFSLSFFHIAGVDNLGGGEIFEKPVVHQVAQTDTSVKSDLHIFGIGSRLSAWKYKFTINGEAFTLKPGRCMEYTVTGDSVIIEITNKPPLISQAPVNLHEAAKEDLYLYLNSGEPMDKFPYTTMAVKEVCKECYEKLSKKCK